MKVFKISTLFFVSVLAFASCNYGKHYKLDDKHDVYYKGDGVDEATAKKLGDYLKAQDYFQPDITATVQLVKTKDTFNVNFVVDAKKIDEQKEEAFKIFGSHISSEVFAGAPTCINLTDTKLEPIKKLGYTAPATRENAAPAQEAATPAQ